jgi:hypothetical protein
MTLRKFDEASLVKRIAGLPSLSMGLFSLCCATRQVKAYEHFAERFVPEYMGTASTIVNRLWNAASNKSFEQINLDSALNEAMDLLPDEQDQWAPFHVYADHAIASLVYAIRCLRDSNPQEAAWSARRALDSADQGAIRDLDIQTGTSEFEAMILAHPFVQRELERQERDLDLLHSEPLAQNIEALRGNAFSESILELNDLSK